MSWRFERASTPPKLPSTRGACRSTACNSPGPANKPIRWVLGGQVDYMGRDGGVVLVGMLLVVVRIKSNAKNNKTALLLGQINTRNQIVAILLFSAGKQQFVVLILSDAQKLLN